MFPEPSKTSKKSFTFLIFHQIRSKQAENATGFGDAQEIRPKSAPFRSPLKQKEERELWKRIQHDCLRLKDISEIQK